MNGAHPAAPGLLQPSAWQRLARTLLNRVPALLLPLAVLLAVVALPQPLRAAASLQEVAPPGAVQQLRQALAEHQPRLTILAPQDDALLPEGPWTLRLRVDDWPLVDAGPAGLGPHLVVQLDDQPPQRLTADTLTMPALTPGSHRLTVYAARPWGEAVKNPGAFRQIRLHRAVANPPALPEPGSPQLIPVLPAGTAAGEPLLLDWLMLDTPLQGLRQDSPGWRLRVSVNGDSFLVDRQRPLWLRGWQRGENAIRLELLDGRGDPLNPPYNSVVRTVELQSGGSRPAWLAAQISPSERDILLGKQPAPALAAVGTEPESSPESQPPPLPPAPAGGAGRESSPEPPLEPRPEPMATPPPAASASPAGDALHPAGPGAAAPATSSPARTAPIPGPAQEAIKAEAPVAAPAEAEPLAAESAPAAAAPPPEPAAAAAAPPEPIPTPTPPPPVPVPAAEPGAGEERLSPQTALEGTARQLVNADGSLRQPQDDGPLARLRQRFGR